MPVSGKFVVACVVCLTPWGAPSAVAQNYHLERIASGLAQPTYLAQAPGDPENIIYYSTRLTAAPGTGGGFSATKQMGGIFRYDMNTRTSTLVMSLEHRQFVGDEGLIGFAFSPDFNTPGAPGYQKLYVSSSQYNGSFEVPPTDRVEEYVVNGPGGTVPVDGMGRPIVNRLILQYDHFSSAQNHTVNWVGFDPLASSLPVGAAERNYLYISTGDGALSEPAHDRPEQKANNVQGKLLRVDVDPANGDAYPVDPLRNFAIPPTNPIPLWNAAHPPDQQLVSTTLNYTSSPTSVTYSPAYGEIYMTGLRNTFRMSFDRLTGDWWGGDVGENAREEINFLRAGTYDGTQPPVDFGYAQREGTIATNGSLGVAGSSGATTVQWNLSGGGAVIVNSTNPIREGDHSSLNTPDEVRLNGRGSYIGGYVYRGPIAELQGQYIYTDYIHGNVFALRDFDRNIPLADYSGTNFNLVNGLAALGTRTTLATPDANSLWQSLIIDPTDPSYTPDIGPSFGLGRIVSFAEDNAGNLYLIDFGGDRGNPDFANDYPNAGLGEIFRLVPNLAVTVTIDRASGAMTFSNATGAAIDIRGYSITSAAGAIDRDELSPITGRLDNSPTGNGDIDDVNVWEITSAPGSASQFSEASTGGAATFAIDEGFTLSEAEGWVQSIYEDLRMNVTLGDGSTVPAVVEFVGTGVFANPFQPGDLNFNGQLDPGDWIQFRTHHLESFAGLSKAQSYQLGDLDGDGDNDFADFRMFQASYVAVHGMAGFAAALKAPEPSSAGLAFVVIAAGLCCLRRRGDRRTSPSLGVAMLAVACVALTSDARAELRHLYTFNDGTARDSINNAHGTILGGVTAHLGVLDFPGGTNDYVSLPAATIGINSYVDATFEAWFSYRGGGAWQRVFDFGRTNLSGSGRDYIYYSPSTGANNNQAAITDNDSSAENRAIGGPPLATNRDYHLAVVVDDASNGGTGRLSLYLDGALAGFASLTQSLSDVSNSLAFLGNSVWNLDPSLNGQIDEFRIYNHALLPGDIFANYLAGPTRAALLELDVNTVTGQVTLVNRADEPLSFDYYRIESDDDAVNVAGWASLDAQNVDAVGTEEGESWDLVVTPSPSRVAEAFVLGASPLLPGESLDLGHAYDTSAGLGLERDFRFLFALQGEDLEPGTVNFITPGPMDGDYNGDNRVDGGDYVAWRNALGTALAAADGDGDGLVDIDDYKVWKFTYGNAQGGGGAISAPVPEPEAVGLAVIAAGLLPFAWRVGKRPSAC